jgi:hypothetical protein
MLGKRSYYRTNAVLISKKSTYLTVRWRRLRGLAQRSAQRVGEVEACACMSLHGAGEKGTTITRNALI